MALIKCPECGREISNEAAFCPHCGKKKTEPPKTSGFAWGCLIIFLVGFLVLSFWGTPSSNSSKDKTSTPETTKPKTQEDIRKEQIQNQFSALDGSHYVLTALIKTTMNNPDSYKHVETVYWDKGDYLIVKTTFRGTNAFGGVVTNWVMVKVDLNGKVTKVISQGP